MVFFGKLGSITSDLQPEDLTDSNVKTFIESLVKAPTTGFDPKVIEGAINGLHVPTYIAHP